MDAMTTLQAPSQCPTIPLTVKRQMVGYQQRLAERIIEARQDKGWSRRELAFHSDISDKTLERLEKAQVKEPRGSTLQRIAEAVGREVSELRPDMETEEKNLRAQIDRMEAKLDELTESVDSLVSLLAGHEIAEAVESGVGEPSDKPGGPARRLRAS